MTMCHEPFLELAALACFEPLPADDAAELETHLAACVGCREAASGFDAAAGALAWSLPPVTPPAGLKAKVFERLLAESQLTPADGTLAPAAPPRLTLVHDLSADRAKREKRAPVEPPVWRAAAIGSIVGLLASLALNVYFWGHVGSLGGQLAVLQSDKVAMEQKVAGMHQQAEQRIAQLAVLQARDTLMAKIPGLPMAKDASAMLFWSATEQAWLVAASGMPQASANQTYQLWAVTQEGQKISMGTFGVDPHGSAVMRIELPKGGMKPAAAAVSLEPAGGMPQPTGPIVMMGELKI